MNDIQKTMMELQLKYPDLIAISFLFEDEIKIQVTINTPRNLKNTKHKSFDDVLEYLKKK